MNKMILTSVTLVAIAGGTLMLRLIARDKAHAEELAKVLRMPGGRRVIEIPRSAPSMTIR